MEKSSTLLTGTELGDENVYDLPTGSQLLENVYDLPTGSQLLQKPLYEKTYTESGETESEYSCITEQSQAFNEESFYNSPVNYRECHSKKKMSDNDFQESLYESPRTSIYDLPGNSKPPLLQNQQTFEEYKESFYDLPSNNRFLIPQSQHSAEDHPESFYESSSMSFYDLPSYSRISNLQNQPHFEELHESLYDAPQRNRFLSKRFLPFTEALSSHTSFESSQPMHEELALYYKQVYSVAVDFGFEFETQLPLSNDRKEFVKLMKELIDLTLSKLLEEKVDKKETVLHLLEAAIYGYRDLKDYFRLQGGFKMMIGMLDDDELVGCCLSVLKNACHQHKLNTIGLVVAGGVAKLASLIHHKTSTQLLTEIIRLLGYAAEVGGSRCQFFSFVVNSLTLHVILPYAKAAAHTSRLVQESTLVVLSLQIIQSLIVNGEKEYIQLLSETDTLISSLLEILHYKKMQQNVLPETCKLCFVVLQRIWSYFEEKFLLLHQVQGETKSFEDSLIKHEKAIDLLQTPCVVSAICDFVKHSYSNETLCKSALQLLSMMTRGRSQVAHNARVIVFNGSSFMKSQMIQVLQLSECFRPALCIINNLCGDTYTTNLSEKVLHHVSVKLLEHEALDSETIVSTFVVMHTILMKTPAKCQVFIRNKSVMVIKNIIKDRKSDNEELKKTGYNLLSCIRSSPVIKSYLKENGIKSKNIFP